MTWELARGIALTLLEGEWALAPMTSRLRAIVLVDPEPPDPDEDEPGSDETRHWIDWLVDDALLRYAEAPRDAIDRFTGWVISHPGFREARDGGVEIDHARWPMPAPEMHDGRWWVPALASHKELASWLGIDGMALTVLADQRSIARNAHDPRHRHYRYAWLAKRGGGHRLVEAPKPRLRGVQRALLDGIVAAIPPHDAAFGFRAGRSVVDAARLHVGREVVLRVDLQSFFASVTAARVAGLFRTVGYPENVAYTLAALCTNRPPAEVLARGDERDRARLRVAHLPQGAPTSGALANLAAYRLDVRIAALARRLDATYTRYADDIVLSGGRGLVHAATTIVARLATIAADEGFDLNFRKTRIMTAARRQRVTGIVVNDKLGIPRAELERLRAILHNCRRDGAAVHNREEHPDFRAYLRGRIAWVASLDAHKGARLAAVFDQIVW